MEIASYLNGFVMGSFTTFLFLLLIANSRGGGQ